MPDNLTEASLDEDRRRSRLGEAALYHSGLSLRSSAKTILSWKCPRCPTKLWQLEDEPEDNFRATCDQHIAWHADMDAIKPPELA